MEWLRREVNKSDHLFEAVMTGLGLGILFMIVYSAYFSPIAETASAEEIEKVAVEVPIEIVYTKEDIIRKIKETFPETPETAVAVAKCESGLRIEIQSHHQLSYGQERSYGLFQVHAPDWEHVAQRLGLEEYKTDLEDNLAMARHIYEVAGKRWTPWSCYTKGMI